MHTGLFVIERLLRTHDPSNQAMTRTDSSIAASEVFPNLLRILRRAPDVGLAPDPCEIVSDFLSGSSETA